MANRSMEQKRLKIRRQKRAWFNTLRGRGGQQPNRDIVKMYAHHARGLEDVEFVDRVADAKGPFIAAKKQSLKKQGELEGWLPEGCILSFSGPGPDTPYQECRTYCNSRKDCFVVVHKDLNKGIERRSMTYSSKELLLMCWEGDAIRWVYKKEIVR